MLGMKKLSFKINLESIDDTKKFATAFSKAIVPGLLVCLYGSIGTGKTTFVKYVCTELGIKEEVTSPSFVIINEYYSGRYPIYHFDLYRLEEEGINTIISELEEYSSDNKAVTFVEWAEFSQGNLLENRLDINLSYDEDFSDKRMIEVLGFGNKAEMVLERLEKEVVSCKL